MFRFLRRVLPESGGGTLPGEGGQPDARSATTDDLEAAHVEALTAEPTPTASTPPADPADSSGPSAAPPTEVVPASEEATGTAVGGITAEGEAEPAAEAAPESASPPNPPAAPRRRRRRARQKGGAMSRPDSEGARSFDDDQRRLVLEIWESTNLPAKELSALLGVSPHTLYGWRHRLKKQALVTGDSGDASSTTTPDSTKPESSAAASPPRRKRGRPPKGSRLPKATQSAILAIKEDNPTWGIDRIADVLQRWEGLKASPGAIQRVLEKAGYEVISQPTRRHAAKGPQRFERARPNQLWQSDLFSFVLRRQGARCHVVIFLDDHSRFVVGHALHAIASGAMVRETYAAAGARWGFPTEGALTDRGPQYHSWRGKSAFTKLVERHGGKHIVAQAKHPQTVGKTERFWGTLWRELIETAIFRDIDDARVRVCTFIDWYNFVRPHQALDGLVPADRFFAAAPEVKETLRRQVTDNALELAKEGSPRKPLYLSGRVGDLGVVSLHAEGERVILVGEDGRREEVDLAATGRRSSGDTPPSPVSTDAVAGHIPDGEGVRGEHPPGTSPLDAGLAELDAAEPAGGDEDNGDGDDDTASAAVVA
jgi:transposase InsO family protein